MKNVLALACGLVLLVTGVRGVEVSAPSALLMEKETGEILFAKDEHTPREPASVTKIMTLLLTMEAIDSGQFTYDTLLTASAASSKLSNVIIFLVLSSFRYIEQSVNKLVCMKLL